MSEVRRHGVNVWRPSVRARLSWVLLVTVFLVGTTSLAMSGPLPTKDGLLFACADIAFISLSPVVLFRWRMVLGSDVVSLVFLRVRRIELRRIVEAKVVPREGLTFVLDDGSTESFGALGNTAWAHRRATASRADLAARAVLVAAAEARGEEPPLAYRLPPIKGLKRAAVEDGIWALVVGLIVGNW
ncbi:hypothetical protein [Phycicoccus sp. DTK01]|uniref:hypothetical protein n=1 Tax=Phycicoccus sp. DTK01 TaxID=2785745 RepID=UPI001A8E234B|nr:hypothetical protein [Phycicoccus sp. DTK01]